MGFGWRTRVVHSAERVSHGKLHWRYLLMPWVREIGQQRKRVPQREGGTIEGGKEGGWTAGADGEGGVLEGQRGHVRLVGLKSLMKTKVVDEKEGTATHRHDVCCCEAMDGGHGDWGSDRGWTGVCSHYDDTFTFRRYNASSGPLYHDASGLSPTGTSFGKELVPKGEPWCYRQFIWRMDNAV